MLADYSGEEKTEDKKVAEEGDYDYEDGRLIFCCNKNYNSNCKGDIYVCSEEGYKQERKGKQGQRGGGL